MEIPRHWRLKKQRYNLVGDICPQGHANFPPDDVCKQCPPDSARASAVDKAKHLADRDLLRANVQMLAKQREEGSISKQIFELELDDVGVVISFSK